MQEDREMAVRVRHQDIEFRGSGREILVSGNLGSEEKGEKFRGSGKEIFDVKFEWLRGREGGV